MKLTSVLIFAVVRPEMNLAIKLAWAYGVLHLAALILYPMKLWREWKREVADVCPVSDDLFGEVQK